VSGFVLVANVSGAGLPRSAVDRCSTALTISTDNEQQMVECYTDSVLAWTPDTSPPVLLVRLPELDTVAIGIARVDNRQEILSQLALRTPTISDVELIVRWILHAGVVALRQIVGDYSLALWNSATKRLVAARDAFGVKTLYYAMTDGRLLVSTHAAAITQSGRYDRSFLAQFLFTGRSDQELTAFSDVTAIPAGRGAVYEDGRMRIETYWRPDMIGPQYQIDAPEATNQFRDLFFDAIRTRVMTDRPVWSRLSGGVDSSSIVCATEYLASRGEIPHRLGGTVTTVDSLGRGDERIFSNSVLTRYAISNVTISDYWMWQEDGAEPPLTDAPFRMYPFYARDRRSASVIREGGGNIALCGMGADHYLSGTVRFATDLAAKGKPFEALRELHAWAASYRQSIWPQVFRQLVLPFMPMAIRRRYTERVTQPPTWLNPSFMKDTAILEWMRQSRGKEAIPSARFLSWAAQQLTYVAGSVRREVSGAGIDMRYPFLHRPLVEFCLRLPPQLICKPHRPKWILREAMASILPDEVRNRTGKGTIGARMIWSLIRERDRLAWLLKNPILGDLGCVDVPKLRHSVAIAQTGGAYRVGRLHNALALETWLRARSGSWVEGLSRTRPAA